MSCELLLDYNSIYVQFDDLEKAFISGKCKFLCSSAPHPLLFSFLFSPCNHFFSWCYFVRVECWKNDLWGSLFLGEGVIKVSCALTFRSGRDFQGYKTAIEQCEQICFCVLFILPIVLLHWQPKNFSWMYETRCICPCSLSSGCARSSQHEITCSENAFKMVKNSTINRL